MFAFASVSSAETCSLKKRLSRIHGNVPILYAQNNNDGNFTRVFYTNILITRTRTVYSNIIVITIAIIMNKWANDDFFKV